MNHTIEEIIFEELAGQAGDLGLITLNRPNVLNALNHRMFIALDKQLSQWENKKSIKAVVIKASEGRAFCAGGDIRHAYERKLEKDKSLTDFFVDEYRMNKRIFHFPKPYIALLDGLTMGGGVGVSIHGSHRVATERFIFSMPETGIGFYPDVGGTYLLSRLPYQMGIYLGLTGSRISAGDSFSLGIVDEIVERAAFDSIISDLAADPHCNVTKILKSFSFTPPSSELLTHKKEIEICFSKTTVEEILHCLENTSSEWCHKTAKILKTKSPTSLKVTLEALHRAKNLSFDECMEMEQQLTTHFIEGHDFFEGIRAVVIDKDQKPVWKPNCLEDISKQDIDRYFDTVLWKPLLKGLEKIPDDFELHREKPDKTEKNV